MNRRFVWTIAAVGLAVVLTAFTALRHSSKQQAHSTPGATRAPDFTLETINGESLRLSDYRGKVILLDFWATWCAPCKQEIPRFIDWQNRYGAQGLQVIGISMDDTAEPVRKYSRAVGINYPVALANEDVAARYGGILGVPVNFIIARDGTVTTKHVGETDLSLLERELTSQLRTKP